MAIKRIGILTGSGDVPGLNAVIKSATYRRSENDIEIFGLRRGWEALTHLNIEDASSRSQCLRATVCGEHLYTRQGLTLQPFQEGAAGGRNISKSLGHNRAIKGRDRVPAAGDRDELASLGQLRRRFRDFNCTLVEWLHLEGAERPVPHKRLRLR
jgi:hypothetical protein